MKVIVPVKDKKKIATGFNSTPEVCVYDLEKNISEGSEFKNWKEIIPPGTKITLRLKQENIHAVLTSQMQLLALNLFRDNGIDVYKSEGDDLFSNLNLLREGQLGKYSTEQALENGKICGEDCESCSSDTKCE